MDAALKEVAKIEKLSGKGHSYPSHDSLDSLLSALHETRTQVQAGRADEQTFVQLATLVEAKKKEIDDRQKETYSSLSRLGKALDKVSHPHGFRSRTEFRAW